MSKSLVIKSRFQQHNIPRVQLNSVLEIAAIGAQIWYIIALSPYIGSMYL